jgi:hypothetical protein
VDERLDLLECIRDESVIYASANAAIGNEANILQRAQVERKQRLANPESGM